MSITTSSRFMGHESTRFHLKPYQRPRDMSWNPLFILGTTNFMIRFEGRVQFDRKLKRNSLTVYAHNEASAPLPSTPPPSSRSIKSWLLGLVVSLILPFFSHKVGPLWVVEKRIAGAVQTMEEIVEVVEKVAEEVEKIAEDLTEDLPQGKLKEVVEIVEEMAEKTVKTAESLEHLIKEVEGVEQKVESVLEYVDKEVKSSDKELKKKRR